MNPSYQDILQLFEKTDQKIAALAIAQDRTDAQLAKTDAQLAKTDAQLAASTAGFAELRAHQAETSTQLAQTDALIRRIGKQVGGISNNQGEVTEQFFFKCLYANPVIADIHFDQVIANMSVGRAPQKAEFDIVLLNGDAVAIIEVKYKAHMDSIEQLESHIQSYRAIFPQHKNHKLYAGLASMAFDKSIVEAAKQKGFFILQEEAQNIKVETDGLRVF